MSTGVFILHSKNIRQATSPTMVNIIHRMKRSTLILAPNKTLTAQLYDEMKQFFPENAVELFVSYYDYFQPEMYLPGSNRFIEKDSSINEHLERLRLSTTKSLVERRDTIVVASVSYLTKGYVKTKTSTLI